MEDKKMNDSSRKQTLKQIELSQQLAEAQEASLRDCADAANIRRRAEEDRASGCSLIISKFRSPYSGRSYIGAVGPTRQNYRNVMHLVY